VLSLFCARDHKELIFLQEVNEGNEGLKRWGFEIALRVNCVLSFVVCGCIHGTQKATKTDSLTEENEAKRRKHHRNRLGILLRQTFVAFANFL
jgi:hypothetical protein